MQIAALRAQLLAWYRAHRRDLPWRRTRDPYAVWISEVMLQQTRVDTVIPYYQRFLDRWPTVRALAEADPAEVRAAWSGLGYYRRAQLMLRAAATLVRDHGGELPRDLDQLHALPGFGRYTAGAVGSIAFDLEAPAVDGNVSRVLARVFGIEGDIAGGPGATKVWSAAERFAKGEAPGDLTQAMIELGALVCTPRAPRCEDCPLASACVALRDHSTATIPPPRKRAQRTRMEVTALLLLDRREARVVLERQPAGGLFAELWCLPMLDGLLSTDAVIDEAERKYGWTLAAIDPVFAEVTHVLTHRDIVMRIVRAADEVKLPRSAQHLARLELAELDRHALPSMTARALRAALPKRVLARAKLPGRSTRTKRSTEPTLF